MSDIKITQEHNLSLEEARQAARKVAAQMELDYEMTTTWDGDLLKFERSGVSGSLARRQSTPDCAHNICIWLHAPAR